MYRYVHEPLDGIVCFFSGKVGNTFSNGKSSASPIKIEWSFPYVSVVKYLELLSVILQNDLQILKMWYSKGTSMFTKGQLLVTYIT